ncbi:MAG: alanine:cation symporter family protein [Candidatus Marinimicrobia bacterium]|nr:alanine:cation symporter family protein [Candidatus Neomarinimicrobiota bacterium]MCF7851522.1 alanine:cation symporter family protein [Candidatus Neomarinimicrobiota bacterium]MCF7905557.1 alanine:cation symporter family protein [Candidatus Neomarinimicrobiota bacterium]
MSRSKAGIIAFSLIALFLYAFGVDFFDAIWSFPSQRAIPFMVLALVGSGIFITVYLGFPQIKRFWHGVQVTMGIYDDPEDEGDLNHFRALTTALSATVGIGNIAGVAIAIYYGGPGALLWMWITAFFGTTLKFAESTLALRYREMDENGDTAGGPMYTIENGLGIKWRWLAVAFAAFTVICSMATGNAIQSFTVSDQVYSEVSQIVGTSHWLTVKHQLFEWFAVSVQQIINGLLMAVLVGLVIIGGIKRIGKVTGYLAPIMASVYILAALFIIFAHIDKVGEAFGLIFSMAVNPPAMAGGVGGGVLLVMLHGIKRGLYSNEAGQGSAAIAHSTAKTNHPVREGAVAMLGPFIDTIMICTLTGLAIITTGAWQHTEFYVRISVETAEMADQIIASGIYQGKTLMNSSLLTSFAFKEGLSGMISWGDKIITMSILLFALSTAISWSFYGDRASEYLFGERAIFPYRWVYVFFVFLGGIASLDAVWKFGDAALGFMTFPNLVAIVLLSRKLKGMTNDYFAEEHIPYKKR